MNVTKQNINSVRFQFSPNAPGPRPSEPWSLHWPGWREFVPDWIAYPDWKSRCEKVGNLCGGLMLFAMAASVFGFWTSLLLFFWLGALWVSKNCV